MPTATANPTRIVTGEVRLSYCHVWEPHKFDNDDEDKAKYSAVVLIPKSDKATMKKLRAAEAAAVEAGVASKWGGKKPPASQIASVIHDGDEEADLDKNPEYAEHWYLAASSKNKPGIVDKDVNPILDQSEVYSGCYARVSLVAFPYKYANKKGIGMILGNIQKLRDGEAFSGAMKADDEFEAVEVEEGDDLI